LALPNRNPDFVRIIAPARLGLHGVDRAGTLQFCRRVRNGLIADRHDLILDFSRTVFISSTGMLPVMAELDRALRMIAHTCIVRCRLPSREAEEGKIVGQVLDQIGLLTLIGQDPPPEHASEDFHQSVSPWRYATGTRIDEKPGDVLEKHEGRIAPAVMEGMQKGLAEAIVNSLHHAYRQARNDGCGVFQERRWWMFTHEADGMLSVVVCDLGIGIPRSLQLNWPHKLLASIGAVFEGEAPAVRAIKTALVLGETSTGEDHRGKGLPQVWAATQKAEEGSVGIYSDRAYVGNTTENETISRHFGDRFLGTLVWWSVPIETTAVANG
jgi:hypothetical protein